MKASEKYLERVGKAILALRKHPRVMLTQGELARELEKRLDMPKPMDANNVQRWEKKKVMPSGDIMLELLKLCPDSKSLADFGIDIDKYARVESPPGNELQARLGPPKDAGPGVPILVEVEAETVRTPIAPIAPAHPLDRGGKLKGRHRRG